MELVEGGALDDAGHFSVIENHPLANLYSLECDRECAPDPRNSGLPMAPRHGWVEFTGHNEPVPHAQEMRLREFRQFPHPDNVTLTGQFGICLQIRRVPNLHIATPRGAGNNPELAMRTTGVDT